MSPETLNPPEQANPFVPTEDKLPQIPPAFLATAVIFVVVVTLVGLVSAMHLSHASPSQPRPPVEFREPKGMFTATFPKKPRRSTHGRAWLAKIVTYQSVSRAPKSELSVSYFELPNYAYLDNEEGMRGFVEEAAKMLVRYSTERTKFHGRSALKIIGEDKAGMDVEVFAVRIGDRVFSVAAGGPPEFRKKFFDSVRLHGTGKELFQAAEDLPVIWNSFNLPDTDCTVSFPSQPGLIENWRGMSAATTYVANHGPGNTFALFRLEVNKAGDLNEVFKHIQKALLVPDNAIVRSTPDSGDSLETELEWMADGTLHSLRMTSVKSRVIGVWAAADSKLSQPFFKSFAPTRKRIKKTPKRIPTESEIDEAIAKKLLSTSRGSVDRAFRELMNLEPSKNFPLIPAALNRVLRDSPDGDHRSNAAQFLSAWGDRSSTEALIAALDDKSRSVRESAYKSIALRKAPLGMDELFFRFEDARTRGQVIAALEFAGPKVVHEVGRYVNSNADDHARSRACDILGDSGSSAALSYLKRAEKDSSFFVRNSAKDAIKKLDRTRRRQRSR